MANIMVRNRDERSVPAMRARPRSIIESLLRSPFPELTVARELMDSVMPVMSEVASFVPNVELREENGNYVIDVALPGFKREDIDIEISGNEITISGKYERKEENAKTHYSEMRQASFVRTIVMPAEINPDRVTATFENGVLRITAPPTAPISAKKVSITGGTDR